MHAAGLDYAGPIVADAKLHRYKASGDKEPNSYYVLHGDFPSAGAFGCWKRGIKETWCQRNGERQLSQAQWTQVREKLKAAKEECEWLEAKRHADASTKAELLLAESAPVTAHPYLEAKGIKPHGDLREYQGAILVPLRDADGKLWSLQEITSDGQKRFLRGSRVAGCSFTLADNSDGPQVLCEGPATGASIHEATGFAVVCAMDCGNLPRVAAALRAKSPQREIIIAGDDDWKNEKNSGVEKATEAALAVSGKLALPKFKDASDRGTDFNDLAQKEGLEIVKHQIQSASIPEPPKESDEQLVTRLAAMPPLEYERAREAEAKRLGFRTAILDRLVEAKRPRADSQGEGFQGRSVELSDIEPWPEAVDGAAVLEQIVEAVTRYVVLPIEAAAALVLWCAHVHIFKAFSCTPRLNITAPDKQCGKTTLRDVVAQFVPRPLLAENLSAAVLFRLVEKHAPTILADEYDSWLRDNEELRGLLNAGHRRGASVYRCEGDDHEVRAFGAYAPAVLCGIGSLPGTLYDRSIVIRLVRARPGEVEARFDSRQTSRETELCRKLARWTQDHRAAIEDRDPALPPGAFNRLGDNWRPLFAIAEVAAGDWPARAAAAYAALTASEDSDAQGVGAMLLTDIAAQFSTAGVERLASADIVEALVELEGRPWAEWGRSQKPMTVHQLARQLKKFDIAPKMMQIPGHEKNVRGYDLGDFANVFARFLPEAENSTAPPSPAVTKTSKPQPAYV
jgi:putative DNA primase/helicase